MKENYKFVQNSNCEYFPCHKGLAEEKFNCLFCFCPLYALADKCGGNFTYTNNTKDCSKCTIPHGENGYEYVMSKMDQILKIGSVR